MVEALPERSRISEAGIWPESMRHTSGHLGAHRYLHNDARALVRRPDNCTSHRQDSYLSGVLQLEIEAIVPHDKHMRL